MLIIRKEQMAVLGEYMRQRFEDRMVRHIAESFPTKFNEMSAASSGHERVRALIQQGIKKAAGYDITTERDVGRFIELLVGLGPDFETRAEAAWAQSILRDETLSGRARIGLIHQQLPARLREAARAAASLLY